MSKVVVVGDAFVSSKTLRKAAEELHLLGKIEIVEFQWGAELTKSEFQKRIKQIELEGPEKVEICDGILEELATAEYLLVHISPVSKKMIQAAPNLKLIGTCRGGLEHLAMSAAKERGIPVLHVIRNAEAVAEFTIGLMYAVTRNIALSHEQVKNGNWPKAFPNDSFRTTLSEHVVGLVGLGHIGKLVAKHLNHLGVIVLAYDPFVDPQELKGAGISLQLVGLEELFRRADIVSLHLRVVPETMNLIDQTLLSLMKPSAYLINTARPEILVKEDFVQMLAEQRIAGAAIDVTWEEPIQADDPLLRLNNLTITPHLAGDTVDAIPKSPFLLSTAINEYLDTGICTTLIQ
ncbi:oxidoreductase [Enterococcus florum]|uniref:Oxidoreductase n=1 Tax=Enterococcus florum TaxID=2480627 RepID=A0A4P5PII6_9ENTE|nr:2-hydroxyacid dehydrogenase [Enterococcus florum]GCF93173.1 oxidoreductase [Enterococcus florum]